MSRRLPISIDETSYACGIQWLQALPKVDIGPDSRHLFKIDESSPVNYVKLNMYPDGGIVSESVSSSYILR